MAGIYIHIPFCKTRCIYCDFYSTTKERMKSPYIKAVAQELISRKEYLNQDEIATIYFGGGTPSQLDEEHFNEIFKAIESNYKIAENCEITLEANPDDLTTEYIEMLAKLPFNRISMGIQTFNEKRLRLLNRRHNAQQAIKAVRNCQMAGFNNISIDLIYGLPNETLEDWKEDLKQAIALKVQHISAYHLTYEEGTPIYKMLLEDSVHEVTEEHSLNFYKELIATLSEAGYEHYEISNFALPHKRSKHNSNYWKAVPYLGCGAAAHSFNRTSREWNVASVEDYIKGINADKRVFNKEDLDVNTRYNDLIVTAIRTKEGLHLKKVREQFGDFIYHYCMKMAQSYIEANQLSIDGEYLALTEKGVFISDSIMRDLLYVEE